MDGRIFALTLLCLALPSVSALTVTIPNEVYEHARGDNITLPCNFKPKVAGTPKLAVISWSAEAAQDDGEEPLILTYYSAGEIIDIKSTYEGRVSLDVDIATGKADLKLTQITLRENKEFECRVQIPGDDEGIPSDTARVVVLVAPSTPICKIQGKAEYGQNINLTCVSEEGSPPPTYKWDSRDVRNMPRVQDPRTTDKGGILSLYNISKDTSGYYICTSSNKIRSASCNITLSVMPPSMNIGSTAGIIGGAVAALIILIIIIYCCCCRKKKEEEEYAMGVRADEYHDKEPAENGDRRHADGQEDKEAYNNSRPVERSERYEERNERNYDDRRSDYDDRRSDYDDRRSDYDTRRSDYDDRRSDYDDRRSDYDDRRDRYSDRHERYEDDRRYDDERRYNDRKDRHPDDDRYDDRDRASKPPRRDYDD